MIDSMAFTVNVPSAKFVREVDFVGIASGKNTDKFKETGLTPVKSEQVNAPYIDEFSLIVECKLLHTHEIGLHTQFIGEIVDVKADTAVIAEDGKADMTKIDPFVFSATNRTYYAIGSAVGKAFSIGKDLSDK